MKRNAANHKKYHPKVSAWQNAVVCNSQSGSKNQPSVGHQYLGDNNAAKIVS
jgi:hypothetical protein